MKKIILCGLLSLLTPVMAHAAPAENGIIVYAEGQQTCYLFKQMPTVTYKSEGKDVFALLSVEGKETPVVSLKLEGDSKLVIEYGEVDETGITTVSTAGMANTSSAGALSLSRTASSTTAMAL